MTKENKYVTISMMKWILGILIPIGLAVASYFTGQIGSISNRFEEVFKVTSAQAERIVKLETQVPDMKEKIDKIDNKVDKIGEDIQLLLRRK